MTSWTSTSTNNGQQVKQTGTLTWNSNGTLQQLQVADTTGSGSGQTCSYVYDDLARTDSVNCGTGQWAQNFTYDAFGNIQKNVPTGDTGTVFQALYGSNNRITNLGFQYDADGNVLQDNLSNLYNYDVYGRPNSVVGSLDLSLTNDAFGRTVEWTGPTQAVYSPEGGKFAFMNGSTLIRYIDPMVAGMARIQNGDGTSYFQHADWLGSSWLGVHGYDGSIAYDRAYAPFGETYNESSSTNRNFTGETQDTTSGIYDFPFRQYSPSQGRWLVPDPAGLAAVDITNPQTWNRYAYVGNNPLSNVDPLGLHCAVHGDELIGCGGGGGSYDASAGVDAAGNFAPGGVAWFGAYGGWGTSTGAPGDGSWGPCGAWCAPPASLLGNITASQNAYGDQLYEDWEQQALADLANQAASPQNCQTRILTAVNAQFGTSFTSDSNVGTGPDAPFQYSTGAPQGGGTLNIDIFPGTGQGGGISPGRYPVNWWTYIIGVGSTLHIPSGPSGTESSSTLVFSSNGFTAHLDSAYPYNPIGFIAHVLADMTGLGGYKPCP